MIKASFTLPNATSIVIEGKVSLGLPSGTLVTVEGIPEDVQKILDNFNGSDGAAPSPPQKPKTKGNGKSSRKQDESSDIPPDVLTKIVNLVKSCPEAEAIEKNVLEKRPSETDRVLLPLYIVHEYLENAYGLTTVEIETITIELGPNAKISRQNALRALTKRLAAKYISADKIRKHGVATRYTLNDRGVEYIKSILKEPVPT